jgi:hypothetical protein
MRSLNAEELLQVSGGWVNEPPKGGKKKGPKGNNGWGNGAEGTNPGSNSGATAGSKRDELWTAGDGPKPAKFFTR